MTQKLFERQLNELSIISKNFTFKHNLEYKLDVFKKSLETLQSANVYVEIPYELLEKVDKIFKLIPNHDKYFVEINHSNHQIYLKLIEELNQIVVKNYIGKVDEIRKHLKSLAGNLSSVFVVYYLLRVVLGKRYEIVGDYLGYVGIVFISFSIALFVYQRIKWLKMRYL